MNTIIGFGCAMGMDLGFNSNHHNKDQKIKKTIHVHANGHKHEHHPKANQHKHDEKKSSEKDDCCNDKVIKFQTAEKNIIAKKIIDAPAILAIVRTYPGIDLFKKNRAFPQKNIKRFFYPPPPDILLYIQKFQV